MRRTASTILRRRIASSTSRRRVLFPNESNCFHPPVQHKQSPSTSQIIIIRPLSSSSSDRRDFDVERFVNEFVNRPIGDLDDEDWEELEYYLRKCCRQADPSSVKLSFQVLDRIIRSIDQEEEANPPSNFNPLNMVVMNWRNTYQSAVSKKHDRNLPTPQAIVDQIDVWRSADDSCLQPDAKTYTMIMEALLGGNHNKKIKNMNEQDVLFAGGLLEWMLEESKKQFQIQPTTYTFAAVMNILSKSDLPDPPQKIKALIDKMKVLENEGWPDISPNLVVYNTWLHSLSRAGNVEQAQHVLQQMLTGEIPGVEPDRISFTALLSGYAKQQTQQAAENAETLLLQMHKLYKSGGGEYDSLKPNMITYTIVMDCYAKLGQGEKAEALLRKLLQLYQETNDPDWEADLATYNTVLLAWARSNQPKHADRFLQFLYEEADVTPDERSFNIVLSAWAKVGNAEQAEIILTRMHELYVEGELNTQPTTVTYNTVLDSWKNSNQTNAWKRSIKILDHMMELHDAGEKAVKPNERTWNAVLNALAKAGRVDLASQYIDKFTKAYQQGDVDQGPSIRAWNALLAACLKKKDVDSAQKIWLQLQNNQSLSPDVVTYNTLLNCYAKSPQRRRYRNQMETTYQRLQHDANVKPNKISYLAILNYWIQSRQVDKAESLLDEWCENHDLLGTSFPDRDLFHVVLNGWSYAKKPRHAESLVLKMADLSERPNHRNLKPNVETYNRLLNVWARSNARDAGERSDAILRQMQSFAIGSNTHDAVAPDIISYNSVLNSWANSGDPTAVTRIEGLVMEMILKGLPALTPTLASYGTWLKAIENSGEDDKARRAREVLKTMKIHQLEPSEYILQKVKSFSVDTANAKK
ncbi:unnamed protein product [Cylindrotheca closterium]|uniref:Pentacotripeptide-repeat region of PRORP domain-containing protein n=1 Tax=Cylindrotheca closterium TaxID=2856 RepID=A0AAD2FFE1_9STRA|nr:unnamed protein product [Cylindrotheca closterium]